MFYYTETPVFKYIPISYMSKLGTTCKNDKSVDSDTQKDHKEQQKENPSYDFIDLSGILGDWKMPKTETAESAESANPLSLKNSKYLDLREQALKIKGMILNGSKGKKKLKQNCTNTNCNQDLSGFSLEYIKTCPKCGNADISDVETDFSKIDDMLRHKDYQVHVEENLYSRDIISASIYFDDVKVKVSKNSSVVIKFESGLDSYSDEIWSKNFTDYVFSYVKNIRDLHKYHENKPNI